MKLPSSERTIAMSFFISTANIIYFRCRSIVFRGTFVFFSINLIASCFVLLSSFIRTGLSNIKLTTFAHAFFVFFDFGEHRDKS